MSETKLEVTNLVRRFKDVAALDDFSIKIEKGEFVSLLGPSGCGKTTALRIIAGLDRQNSGNVFISGTDISAVPANKRNMGMVFQQYSLFPNLNTEENIAFGLSVRGVESKKRTSRARELLELVGLQNLGHRFPHQLSGGQQQRVALARAIAFEPEILLLDEPLSALDAQVRLQIREEIRRIQIEYGITTLFVTHDQEEAMAISDRVAVMNSGRLEQIDKPHNLYSKPESPFVASFVGTANRLPGKISSGNSVRVLKQELSISRFASTFKNGDEVQAYVRPESIRIASRSKEKVSHGLVAIKSFLGPTTILGVKSDGLPLIHIHADSKELREYEVGDEVSFVIDAEEIMVSPL
jgi:putative spermidine/putrescine transport system ATP-binding protein